MKTLKKDLVVWLVNENNDCGKDTYFTSAHPRTEVQLTTEESYKKFMKMAKDELISIIYNFSDEGQKFLEVRGVINN